MVNPALLYTIHQNDLGIIKLLLNHEYDPEEEAKREAEEQKNKKTNMVRQHSRRLFTLGQLNIAGLAPQPAQGQTLPLVNGDAGDAGADKEEEKEAEDEDDMPADGK